MTKTRNLSDLLDANGDVKTSALDNVPATPDEVAVSASAPSSPSEGDLWYDTTNEILKVYNITETAFVKVVRVIPTLDGITGDIVNGATSNLTLAGTGFLSTNLIVAFTPSGGSATNVSVTPASDTSAVVAVPAAIYNQSAGTSIGVKVTNSDNRGSGTLNKIIAAQATGGTEVTTGGYKYHTFTSSGNFVLSATKNIEYIMVAGGGSSGRYGGGGGAGGMLAGSVSNLAPNTYPIVVGAGGVHTGANTGNNDADNGDNTTFNSLTAIGGGKGATGGDNGFDGGSGGGGSYGGTSGGNGTSGQGNNGGGSSYSNPYPSGGGGGKGAAGTNASSAYQAGSGGDGINTYSAWATATSTGDSGYYAGGGAGGVAAGSGYHSGGSGGTGGQGGGGNGGAGGSGQQAGQANTGGGGGSGAYNGSSSTGFPTNGGSGIVIIRYSA